MTTFHIITIFPTIFDSYFNESIIRRAQDAGKIKIEVHNLRDWTTDKHKSVDDTPYGGGAGMVMKIEPLYRAITEIKSQTKKIPPRGGCRSGAEAGGVSQSVKTILLSAKGKTWNQPLAKEHSQQDNIILICGRYEGVDERITKFIDEEISIGDYVLTGGEIPAMAIVDSITRLIPGVLGNEDSPLSESHSEPGVLEYPQYTKPEIFTDDEGKNHKVPPVLMSGHHAKIEKWREGQKKKRK